MTAPAFLRSMLPFAGIALASAVLGAAGVQLWGAYHTPVSRVAIEQVVHDYIIAHPEVLPEAMDHLRQQETTHQLAGLRGDIETPWPGATLGNPHGRITLVEFTDYACGFCRRSVADVATLTAANPDLRIVVRELPILTPASADAARMALAAAGQGRYAAFRSAMFGLGKPDATSIAAAAQAAGIDMAAARQAMADPRVESEIARNLDLARQLGFSGTPSWIVGNRVLSGAVGAAELGRAVSEARG